MSDAGKRVIAAAREERDRLRIEALEAEVERLRGRLYYIAENGDEDSRAVARAALSQDTDQET